MNIFIRNMVASTAFITFTMLLSHVTVAAESNDSIDTKAIRLQLQRYEQALNDSDAESVMQLYAEDAVAMPQNSNPLVGRDSLRAAVTAGFKAVKLNVKFVIDEIQPLSSAWAYARTRSTGTINVLGSDGLPNLEANQEIFLFHKESDGEWRVARYIFSTTNPAAIN
ncbi:YybH family protein [Solimicrobium silvestre]|uniref:DUF4440 domain-containing protein n=1 Tax=Solimicrobium silvestre TaxID=2099400 RepID=A0A2S9H3M2_9BURK|nr:SgcJ/EcaC family oxidoreductase [Solimicrobium silvestre]PRC94582.1 hypothetical protein S2091_0585 [Solimicrobium silvestre]